MNSAAVDSQSSPPPATPVKSPFLLPIAVVAALASATALSLLNGPLRNPVAPFGVVSLETARTVDRAHAVIASWGAHQTALLAFSTGLAFFCSAAFTIALAVGSGRLAARAHAAFPILSRVGAVLAAGLWVVGVLWILEDTLLALELFGHVTLAVTLLTWSTAVLKFLALGTGTAYVAVLGAALTLRRK